jgi:hypothetical protein
MPPLPPLNLPDAGGGEDEAALPFVRRRRPRVPDPPADGLARPRRRRFTRAEDERLVELLMERNLPPSDKDWPALARALGPGFSARQTRTRWHEYLRETQVRDPLSIGQRRELLRLSIEHFGRWKWIARRMSGCEGRSPLCLAGIATGMHNKLKSHGIVISHPDDVDALPPRFFRRTGPRMAAGLRDQFLERLPTLPHRRGAGGHRDGNAEGRGHASDAAAEVDGDDESESA